MGGGRGCYAGQPMSFACAMCRKKTGWYERRNKLGRRWRLTGKTRRQHSQGMDYRCWGDTAHQYQCLDCKHIGWSRHPDVPLYARLH